MRAVPATGAIRGTLSTMATTPAARLTPALIQAAPSSGFGGGPRRGCAEGVVGHGQVGVVADVTHRVDQATAGRLTVAVS